MRRRVSRLPGLTVGVVMTGSDCCAFKQSKLTLTCCFLILWVCGQRACVVHIRSLTEPSQDFAQARQNPPESKRRKAGWLRKSAQPCEKFKKTVNAVKAPARSLKAPLFLWTLCPEIVCGRKAVGNHQASAQPWAGR